MRPLHWTLLLISLVIASGFSLVASQAPDGLEHSMQQIGSEEGEPVHHAPMPDYSANWLEDESAQKMVAPAAGVVLVFLMIWAFGRLLVNRKRSATKPIKGASPWQSRTVP